MAEMSAVERFMILNPVRDWFHRGEVDAFRRWSSLEAGAAILEVGCGNGVSTKLLGERLRPRRLMAIDTDPSMIRLARRRLRRAPPQSPIHLAVADATRMPLPERGFDAVFEVGVIHHVPEWRAVLREIGRVLRPGGLFFFAEPSRGRLTRGLYFFVPHDKESMFSPDELVEALSQAGLEARLPFRRLPFWDIAGLARRPD
jgi:ubiquinone/menaquinone biosynthesis C-methylase UbiE